MVISLGAITHVHRYFERVFKEHSLKSRSIWHNIETSDGEVFVDVSWNCCYYAKDTDGIKIAAFHDLYFVRAL